MALADCVIIDLPNLSLPIGPHLPLEEVAIVGQQVRQLSESYQ